jgi:hypothetical protein
MKNNRRLYVTLPLVLPDVVFLQVELLCRREIRELKTRPCTRPPCDRVKKNYLADFLLTRIRGFLRHFFTD